MNPRIIRYAPVLFTLLFLGNVYAAQTKESVKGGSGSPTIIEQDMFPPSVQPTAVILLKEMGAYLEKAKNFGFRAEINFDEVLPTDQKIQYSATINFHVRRPDRVRSEYQGDLTTRRSWYDGNTITVHDIGRNNYAEVKVPGKIDTALDHVMEKYNLSFPLADFLYENPYNTLVENVEYGYYVGIHNVQGVRSHHLAFRQNPSIGRFGSKMARNWCPERLRSLTKICPAHLNTRLYYRIGPLT